MKGQAFTIGIDFGTLSGRALLVNVDTGEEVATAVYEYRHGVIDNVLPGTDVRLPPEFALQDPRDYIRTLDVTIPAILQQSKVNPEHIIGIGIDFTSCTMLPTFADGTPLCMDERFQHDPHAWVKLWKHHAAHREADLLNDVARRRGDHFLQCYGGSISPEWLFPKVWQILNEAPPIYEATDRMIEAGDWVVWQLTGVECRSACMAGYKAIWDPDAGFVTGEFLDALDRRLSNVIADKIAGQVGALGTRAGFLRPEMAERLGLSPQTAVAVANIDAHVSVPACTVVDPYKLVMVMGTSMCHLVMAPEFKHVEGVCGVVKDGIVSGFYGYEAGQPAVGDMLGWFAEHAVPAYIQEEADRRGLTVHQVLEEQARELSPGESGLMALDWWNGNRSILADTDLSGVILGYTLASKPGEIYRALIEGAAFGTAAIIQSFERAGIRIDQLFACGGLPNRNQVLMNIFADVTGKTIFVAQSDETSALGSAMFAAVAAGPEVGGHRDIVEAARHMARLKEDTYTPNPQNHRVYRRLFQDYMQLHDYFGRGGNDVLKRLRSTREQVMREKTHVNGNSHGTQVP